MTLYDAVYAADCAQEIGGVCYSCPEGYPNNLFDNGECFCTSDAGDKVACIKDATSAVADTISTGVESGALALSAGGLCLSALFAAFW